MKLETHIHNVKVMMRLLLNDQAQNSDGRPLLVFSGEEHSDHYTFMDVLRKEITDHLKTLDSQEDVFKFLNEERTRHAGLNTDSPVIACAVTHIAAIQEATRQFGKENVVVSIEYPPAIMEDRLKLIDAYIKGPENLTLEEAKLYTEAAIIIENTPVYQALLYARKNGYQLAASDPGRGHESRAEDEIAALTGIILPNKELPKAVIHVGGSLHFSNMLYSQIKNHYRTIPIISNDTGGISFDPLPLPPEDDEPFEPAEPEEPVVVIDPKAADGIVNIATRGLGFVSPAERMNLIDMIEQTNPDLTSVFKDTVGGPTIEGAVIGTHEMKNF